MQIIITPVGTARCIYGEEIDLAAIGNATITRASHVEPDQHGRWLADMSPVGGPLLGLYDLRSDALAAEHAWLETHWLTTREQDIREPALSSALPTSFLSVPSQ
ncbi:MAG: hypothetical protein ACLP9L_12570 [Thermoguttaceae bacterium]